MTLKGWANPLPDWIVAYIQTGKLVVRATRDFEFLQGTVINPEGTIISFV